MGSVCNVGIDVSYREALLAQCCPIGALLAVAIMWMQTASWDSRSMAYPSSDL